jgi:hypothetical protein
MRTYVLVSTWRFDAPRRTVWNAIHDVEYWPRWWRFVQRVEELERGDADGVGALRRYTWTSRLPYSLSFDMRVSAVRPLELLEAHAIGELNGVGRWVFDEGDGRTIVRYEWTVATAKRWMNLLAPLLGPVFRWNHAQVMREGERGLTQYLARRRVVEAG